MNLEQIRLLLPDYVAGTASDKECQQVEEALKVFPQLHEELHQIRMCMATFPAHRVRNELELRARNISVEVQKRLKRRNQDRLESHIKWSLATTVAAGIAFVVLVLVREYTLPPQLVSIDSALTNEEYNNVRSAESTALSQSEEIAPNDKSYSTRSDAYIPRRNQNTRQPVFDEFSAESLVFGFLPPTELDDEFVEQFIAEFNNAGFN